MCGGLPIWNPPVPDEEPETRVVYTERTEDNDLSGRLRAIADRAQGNIMDAMTVRDMAKACADAGSLRSAAFWRAYAREVETPSLAWPVRRCEVCRSEVVPAVLGALHVLCPVCRPFDVRKAAEPAREAEA